MFRLNINGDGVWLSEMDQPRHVDAHAVAGVLRRMQETVPLGGLGDMDVLCLDYQIRAADDPAWGTASAKAFMPVATLPGCVAISGQVSTTLEDVVPHELTHEIHAALFDGVELAGLRSILGNCLGADDPASWETASTERLAEYVSAALWGREMCPITDRMPEVTDSTLSRVREWALAAMGQAEPAEIVVETIVRMQIGSTIYTVDGEQRTMDVAPLIRKDRTFLPARYVAEALGGEVSWDAAARRVTICHRNGIVSLTIGSNWATKNGAPLYIDAAPFIENDRTMVPVRFISEALGALVDWDQATRTVTISLTD